MLHKSKDQNIVQDNSQWPKGPVLESTNDEATFTFGLLCILSKIL